jgi:hypothetical protein
LRAYHSFSWYDPPLDQFPSEFKLVICDGPPGDTLGGRYGVTSVLGERLKSGAVILLDDANRPGELEILERWQAEGGFNISHQPDATYAIVTHK